MCFRTFLLAGFINLALLSWTFGQETTAPAQNVESTATAQTERAHQREEQIKKMEVNARYGMDTHFLEENLDRAMADGIAAGETSGAVLLIVRGTPDALGNIVTVFEKAYGNRAIEPETEAATNDTIYDLASLTKPIATATSIMKLVEQGKIRLSDRVSKYIPEWKNTAEEERLKKNRDTDRKPRDRESITIRHLLTHTSGLKSYERFYEKYPDGNAHDKIIADIAKGKLSGPVGGQFIYSDLGFIVLGHIVQRVSGLPLNEFAAKELFEPLEMTDTSFTPPVDKLNRIAPTEWQGGFGAQQGSERTMIRGKVHDGNSGALDGVSGHAGLFATADDVGKFCAMMLRNGRGPNFQRILSPVTIATMTRNHAQLSEGEPTRGLGWDIESPYNSQKGNLFDTGYGHTGFTGTSIWIVPEEKLAVIIMANRVHPDGKGDVVGLRSRIANIVAGSIMTSYKD